MSGWSITVTSQGWIVLAGLAILAVLVVVVGTLTSSTAIRTWFNRRTFDQRKRQRRLALQSIATLGQRLATAEASAASVQQDLEETLQRMGTMVPDLVKTLERAGVSGPALDPVTSGLNGLQASLQATHRVAVNTHQQVASLSGMDIRNIGEQVRAELDDSQRRAFWPSLFMNFGTNAFFFVLGILITVLTARR
jgi:hypothetical protein